MSCCGGAIDQIYNNSGPTKVSRMIQGLKETGSEFNKKHLFSVSVERGLEDVTKLTLNQDQLNALYSSTETNFSLDLPGDDGSFYTLFLNEVNIFTKDFFISDGTNILDIPNSKHYFGVVEGYESSEVNINIYQNMISGVIRFNSKVIELVRETVDITSSYLLAKPRSKTPFNCLTDTNQKIGENIQQQISRAPSTNCARIYFDVSNSITNFFGGNVATTTAYIQDVFANVALVYINDPDVEVVLFLNGMTVYTSAPPFTLDLNGYSTYRSSNLIANVGIYNFVQFVPGVFSGVAWLGTFCQPPSGIAGPFTFNNLDSADVVGGTGTIPYPTYSWTLKVLTHEMGHNFGSNHTFDCVWTGPSGPNESLGGCGVTGDSGSCILCTGSSPIGGCFQPGETGYFYSSNGSTGFSGQTIMGYCNPMPLRFGPQPGAVIRAAVDGCTACIVCVHPNTEILMADGSIKLIKNIKRGDLVASDSNNSQTFKVSRVNVSIYRKEQKIGVAIMNENCLDKNVPNKKLTITGYHPIFYKGARREAQYFANLEGVKYEEIEAEKVFEVTKEGFVELYDLQFDDDGSYVANGVQVQSRCPWSFYTPLPKELYYDLAMYKKCLDANIDSLNHIVPFETN